MNEKVLTDVEIGIVRGALLSRTCAPGNMFQGPTEDLLNMFRKADRVVIYTDDGPETSEG